MGTASSVNKNTVKQFEKEQKRTEKIIEDAQKKFKVLDAEVTCFKKIEIFLQSQFESELRNVESTLDDNNKSKNVLDFKTK